jgi:hypothetical protein
VRAQMTGNAEVAEEARTLLEFLDGEPFGSTA